MKKDRKSTHPSASPPAGYDLVIDFFSNIGLSREASMYLKMFRTITPWQFAVVLISAESLKRSARAVAMDLAHLCGLNLYPVIVLDTPYSPAGVLVGERIPRRHAPAKLGERIRSLNRLSSRLVSAISSAGGRAVNLSTQLFDPKTPFSDNSDFDFRLLVGHLDLGPIKSAIRSRQIPLVSPMVMDEEGWMRLISAEKVAKALCTRIQPQKFIVISEEGGITSTQGQLIRNVILSTDYKVMAETGVLDQEGRSRMEAVDRLLHEVPELTVQIASADNLLHELFTVKGRGTYIRMGHTILQSDSYAGLELDSLRKLIEDGFGKHLVEDYFDLPPHCVFYERGYHGVIVVKPLEGDVFYLDKFVVGRKWQGEGMGAPLWRELVKHYQKLVWRADPNNPINRWYIEQADGFQRTGEWNIYWIGLTPTQAGRFVSRVCNIRRTVV